MSESFKGGSYYKPKRFVCSMCDAEFNKWKPLKNHMMDLHSKMKSNKSKEQFINPRAENV